jgi:hypothetical protein
VYNLWIKSGKMGVIRIKNGKCDNHTKPLFDILANSLSDKDLALIYYSNIKRNGKKLLKIYIESYYK